MKSNESLIDDNEFDKNIKEFEEVCKDLDFTWAIYDRNKKELEDKKIMKDINVLTKIMNDMNGSLSEQMEEIAQLSEVVDRSMRRTTSIDSTLIEAYRELKINPQKFGTNKITINNQQDAQLGQSYLGSLNSLNNKTENINPNKHLDNDTCQNNNITSDPNKDESIFISKCDNADMHVGDNIDNQDKSNDDSHPKNNTNNDSNNRESAFISKYDNADKHLEGAFITYLNNQNESNNDTRQKDNVTNGSNRGLKFTQLPCRDMSVINHMIIDKMRLKNNLFYGSIVKGYLKPTVMMKYISKESLKNKEKFEEQHTKTILIDKEKAQISNPLFLELNKDESLILQKIAFLAPEVLKDLSREFTSASDICAFGVIMWSMSSGKPPFENDTDQINLIYKILSENMRETPVIDTPVKYLDLYNKCWEQNLWSRPTIQETCDQLEIILQGDTRISEFVKILIDPDTPASRNYFKDMRARNAYALRIPYSISPLNTL
ncbi:20109_t:CDS:2, partial [Dentiscutata erythropus]